MKNISIIAKVTGSVHTHQFESGTIGGRMPVMVSETWTSQDGAEQKRETPLTVEVWNNLALACSNNLKEGDSIFADGDLELRSFTDREGNFRAILVVRARSVTFLGQVAGSYLRVRGIGNLGRDPEMRYSDAGVTVTNFSVAFNRRYTDSAGERQEDTQWADVSAWNGTAENCNQYLRQGSKVYIEGSRVEADVWQTKEGESRASLRITAGMVQFLDRAADGVGAGVPAGGDDGDDMPW